MKWTMPYPWRSRRDSVRRINMSSEPGNESFFCALRPIPRILSLRNEIMRVKFVKADADQRALLECKKAGGKECAIEASACSRKSTRVATTAALVRGK